MRDGFVQLHILVGLLLIPVLYIFVRYFIEVLIVELSEFFLIGLLGLLLSCSIQLRVLIGAILIVFLLAFIFASLFAVGLVFCGRFSILLNYKELGIIIKEKGKL